MTQEGRRLTYVLITPARNEREFIDACIRSVIAQELPPARWVIVSDGSTDGTDEIVRSAMKEVPWIDLFRMPEHRDRSFVAKAACFNAGYERLKPLDFDLIGNLDADITFEPDYYQFLIEKFASDPRLGVAGTPFVEDAAQPDVHSYAHRFADTSHVSGACQMFRRECFEEVGGYTPIKGGGIDWVAVTTARTKGWSTRTFVEKTCYHHRKMGTAGRGPVSSRFRHGKEDYYLGGHAVWQIARGVFQMQRSPLLIGGISLIAGYFWAMTVGTRRPIPQELIAFHRAEQMARLREMLSRAIPFFKRAPTREQRTSSST